MGLEGSDKSEMTGTPLFMALSVAWGDPHTVSSDLESLFYSLLYIASDGKVSHIVSIFSAPHYLPLFSSFFACLQVPPGQKLGFRRCVAAKATAMLSEKVFEARVIGACQEELKPLIRELRGLFFQRSRTSLAYNFEINPHHFLNICKRHLGNYESVQSSLAADERMLPPSAVPQLGRRQSPAEACVSVSGRRSCFSHGIGVRSLRPTAAFIRLPSSLPSPRLFGLNPGKGPLGCRRHLWV